MAQESGLLAACMPWSAFPGLGDVKELFQCCTFYPQLWWKGPFPRCPLQQTTVPRAGLRRICFLSCFVKIINSETVFLRLPRNRHICMDSTGIHVGSTCYRAVYTKSHGHGKFAGDLFVWELHWNTGCWWQLWNTMKSYCSYRGSAGVCIHWRQPSSLEITSSYSLYIFKTVVGVLSVLDAWREELHNDYISVFLQKRLSFSVLAIWSWMLMTTNKRRRVDCLNMPKCQVLGLEDDSANYFENEELRFRDYCLQLFNSYQSWDLNLIPVTKLTRQHWAEKTVTWWLN